MKRIYEPAAYGPQGGCFWADTVNGPDWPQLNGDVSADVAVIGGGFTGLTCALELARSGVDVVVLEAEHAGYGASGRNGGFCCLGGAKASAAKLAAIGWHHTERAAVDFVDGLIRQHGLVVDRHSQGETILAHKPRRWAALQRDAKEIAALYGAEPTLIHKCDLRAQGLDGPWHGAMTIPVGFALNPRKYHAGLAQAATKAGVRTFARSPVTQIVNGAPWRLTTPNGTVRAKRVVLATNGYSSEDLPDWLRARYLPVQSSVIVTRALTQSEQDAQGWWSDQMAYDTRELLHYFRKMPDGRFLFGMRGGLTATTRARTAISAKIRRDFAALFPAWKDVPITHEWDGLVCLMAGLVPFVGAVPKHEGLFAAMGFHGNGVAMGSYAGHLLAGQITGQPTPYPDALKVQPKRFPLGRWRRALLRPAYIAAETLDL
ncbi:NAD(P)/FAD-dependent oxidoreductase [Tropicibacter naphthalenivorans]|uniref:Gamma-glutamylputrescine oxidoreductase n=1 Tax=Tropicibacter naphthalenivorans TaxID=441103 RepID=A0A0P1GDR2_9RHOB|nr:FAD-binding oxidoreductase [Tropicibacter naphthalenivorans]CUH79888.1 Gamma-glutamylputrescine oxidoreductase [Tropicibacter naphthalenivorans]SMC75955.1 Glycine/D-amino acid oxidase [Tropicibacter naphthalenivorans]